MPLPTYAAVTMRPIDTTGTLVHLILAWIGHSGIDYLHISNGKSDSNEKLFVSFDPQLYDQWHRQYQEINVSEDAVACHDRKV